MKKNDNRKKIFNSLKEKWGYKNIMQTPEIKKIVISTGIGSIKDKKKKELIADRLAKITGQKAAERGAKKSIATFKVRQGDNVGFQVTLRGGIMDSFLNKLINIAFPRTRDFRGIPRKSVDSVGNLTIGIKEHTIFPETSDEDLKDVFGMAITLVSTSKNKDEAHDFFTSLGVPFSKSVT